MSVKIFRIDRNTIISRLKNWAYELSKDKNVLAVILFGSFAKGEETPASDVDVLILLKSSDEIFKDRIPKYIPKGIGIGVDVFPYTREEFYKSLKEKWGVAEEALRNGIFLYPQDISKNDLLDLIT